jgi:hypothetical protein
MNRPGINKFFILIIKATNAGFPARKSTTNASILFFTQLEANSHPKPGKSKHGSNLNYNIYIN